MATVALNLHALLAPLTNIPRQGKSRQSVWAALAQETFSSDTLQMFEALLLARREIGRQLEEVATTPGSNDYLLSQLDKIFDQLDLRFLQKEWSCELDTIDCLLAIESLLSANGYKEQDLALDLPDIQGQLFGIRSDLRNSQIDATIKKYLMESLSSLLFSIDQYETLGELGLKRAYATTLGNLQAIEQLDIDKTEETTEIFSKFSKTLKIFGAGLTATASAATIYQVAVPLLS